MSDVLPPRHAFSHAPAALRIFRFAADSAPRVLELAHASAFLRECAVEFGSADAALPGALRCEHTAKRFFKLRALIERNAVHCPWLAAKLLSCRSGAPVPAAALAPDVTRHDVDWGGDGARRHVWMQPTLNGLGILRAASDPLPVWAQGPVGVTSGRHFFAVAVVKVATVDVGWVDCGISRRCAVAARRAASLGALDPSIAAHDASARQGDQGNAADQRRCVTRAAVGGLVRAALSCLPAVADDEALRSKDLGHPDRTPTTLPRNRSLRRP
jgi:hypothetical protein